MPNPNICCGYDSPKKDAYAGTNGDLVWNYIFVTIHSKNRILDPKFFHDKKYVVFGYASNWVLDYPYLRRKNFLGCRNGD